MSSVIVKSFCSNQQAGCYSNKTLMEVNELKMAIKSLILLRDIR